MKRITAFLLALFIIACFTIGCEMGDSVTVGNYKGPWNGWEYMETYKAYGHSGHDIWNPTTDEATQYCSLCHYVD